MSQATSLPQEQRVSSRQVEHQPTLRSELEEDSMTYKMTSRVPRARMDSEALFSELNTQSELGRDLARRISERFSIRISHGAEAELAYKMI